MNLKKDHLYIGIQNSLSYSTLFNKSNDGVGLKLGISFSAFISLVVSLIALIFIVTKAERATVDFIIKLFNFIFYIFVFLLFY